MVNMVSCCVDVPPGLFGVRDLCCLGDQMLNTPPRQLRAGAGDTRVYQYIVTVTGYHQMHPSFSPCSTRTENRGNTSTLQDTLKRNLEGAQHKLSTGVEKRLEDSFMGLTTHSIRHACKDNSELMLMFIDT